MTETKKESFRKYLEASGVIDQVTKVLVSLYEEPDRPKDALDYMKVVMGGPTPQEHAELAAEKDALAEELADAKEQIAELHARVAQLESPPEGEAAAEES